MRLLVLGVSDIFQRRVLPLLPGLGVTGVCLASASGRRIEAPKGLAVQFFDDAATALDRSPAEAVYVSAENSRHGPLALAALASGRHVVVDKPAFPDPAEALRAADLASRKNLVLAEANVWAGHPRVAAARRAFAQAGSAPARLSALFSFPPLPPGNFRHRPELGGGALLDLGPYAVSPGRVFFEAEPEEVFARVLSRGPAVETAFACQLFYPGGRLVSGLFGFDTGYANRLEVLGPGLVVSLDRAFTPPPGARLALERNSPGDGAGVSVFEPADAFALFFERFFTAAGQGTDPDLIRDLLTDARALQTLRRAARSAAD